MTAQQAQRLVDEIKESQEPQIQDFLATETGANPQSGFVTLQMLQEITPWGLFVWALTHSDSAY
jgi:hypothetical protein